MSEERYILHQCFHCGNRGLMEVKYKGSQEYGGPQYDEIGEIVDIEVEEHFTWSLLSCPVCRKLSLVEDYSDEISRFNFNEHSVLYPQSIVRFEGVPNSIRTAFEAALKVKNIDLDICLLSLRRTLEAICKEQGAKGNTLELMVSDLRDCEVLPSSLDDACWIIRKLGNKAAHADKQTRYLYEVDLVIGFVDTIINYLYTLPKNIIRLKERISEEEGKAGQAGN